MKHGDKVVAWAGVDELCQWCNKPASWRARDRRSGNIIAAACKEHKEGVRAGLVATLLAKQPAAQPSTATEDRAA